MTKISIIGAGPAGLFAALQLANHTPRSFEIEIYEKKNYVGGSGLHSDGKLNFHPQIGGDLLEFTNLSEAFNIINNIEVVFEDLGITTTLLKDQSELSTRASKYGIKYIPIKQTHIGSDQLPKVMKKFKDILLDKGVKFHLEAHCLSLTDEIQISSDYQIVAPGRTGTDWLASEVERFTEIKYNPIDIGVRVEVPNEIMSDITDISWCPKFHIRSKSYDDFLRTFCTCPRGFVVKDKYNDDLIGVNGHSMINDGSENTNFAFLNTIELNYPTENTTKLGKDIASLSNTLGGGKPLIQRLGDLKKHRRSTWKRINRSYIKPTLKDVTPGDISMAFPKRILQNILEGLEKLDSIIPGIYSDLTLLYAPEIKFYAKRIITDKDLRIPNTNIFVAGDGAGISRGIVGAAATGIIAANGILKNISSKGD